MNFLTIRLASRAPSQKEVKVFQFVQERLGMPASGATFSMQAYQTNVLIWRMFMSSSMTAAIHLGPKYLTSSEFYKNTRFEEIESLFNITQKLIMEHSEEILNVKFLESSSHDQAVKWTKLRVCVYADSVLCGGTDEGQPRSDRKMERSSGRTQVVSVQWKISQDFHLLSLLQDQKRLGEAEDPSRGVQRPDHLYVNV